MSVDVIIPVFNARRYIEEAIQSVLVQTHKDLRIIVIDDGSTDETMGIVKRIAAENQHVDIVCLYQTNQGTAAARNYGLRLARGHYIAFLDSDDRWAPTKIEKQVAALEANSKAGFVYSNNDFIDAAGHILESCERKIKIARGNIAVDLFVDSFIITSGVLMRRSCLETVGGFNKELRVREDYDFFLRLAHSFDAEVIEEKVWQQRIVANSLGSKDSISNTQTDLRTLAEFIRLNPDFYREHKAVMDRRMSEYHFSFANHLRENGHTQASLGHFSECLKYQPSLKVYKNMFLCLVPFSTRQLSKEKKCLESAL